MFKFKTLGIAIFRISVSILNRDRYERIFKRDTFCVNNVYYIFKNYNTLIHIILSLLHTHTKYSHTFTYIYILLKDLLITH